ncbi:MAG: DsbA family protein [Thermomicrobiales bacterium]|nr:DsbA family protein [Thermomicrobiales bacterium]
MTQKKKSNTQRKPNTTAKAKSTSTNTTAAKSTATSTAAETSAAATASKRSSRKEAAEAAAKKKRQMQMIIGGVIVAVIVVVIAIFANRPTASGVKIDYTGIDVAPSNAIANLGTPDTTLQAESDGLIVEAAGFSIGDPNAPVTMHIYSDYQCPYCRAWHEDELPQVIDDFVRTGQVRVVFHEFARLGTDSAIADPNDLTVELRDPNNESSLASQAAMCAGEQDHYMTMADKLFGNWSGEQEGAFKRSNLNRFAEDIGLDMDAFNTCMDSGKYIPFIAADIKEGQNSGVSSTPTFVLDNGTGQLNVVTNQANYDLLKKTIEASIKTAE